MRRSRNEIKELRRRLRRRIRYYFILLVFVTLVSLTLFSADTRIALPFKTESLDFNITYTSLKANITLYKLYYPPTPKGTMTVMPTPLDEVNVSLIVGDRVLWFGVYEWSPNITGPVFVNKSIVVELEAGRKYPVFFYDSISGYQVAAAVIDEYYRRSFDSLIELPQFQVHFVFYVYKCDPLLTISYDRAKTIIVKGYDEIRDKWYTFELACNSPCTHKLNGCFIDVTLEALEEPFPGVLVSHSEFGAELLVGKSPLLLALPVAIMAMPLAIAYSRYRKVAPRPHSRGGV